MTQQRLRKEYILFDKRLGTGWRDKHQDFWADVNRTYSVSRGIRERLLHDEALRDKTV